MKWDEAAVGAALRSLRMRTDGKAPDIAETVEMIRIGVWVGQANSRPRARGATRKQTMAELRRLCDLCQALHKHIEITMHSPALRVVEERIKNGREARQKEGKRPLYSPLLLNIQLEGAFAAARAAWLEAKKGGELPQPTNRGTKPAAKELTIICARVFEDVTGRSPARSYNSSTDREGGEFLDFLGKVFEALGVKAKPAGQAKLLMEKRAVEKAGFFPLSA